MRKAILILCVLAILGIALWYFSGGVERMTESRIRTALVERGVPPRMAGCMAAQMSDSLTLEQLRGLRELAPRDDEAAMPRSRAEALDRLRRIKDPEALRVTMRAAASCSLGFSL